MTQKTQNKTNEKQDVVFSGYQVFSNILVDLFGCIIVAVSLGVLCQNLFDTSTELTVALGVVGCIAGLCSLVRYLISLNKGM